MDSSGTGLSLAWAVGPSLTGRGAAAKSRLGLQGVESDECDWVQARTPNLGPPRCCSCSLLKLICMAKDIEGPNPMIWLVGRWRLKVDGWRRGTEERSRAFFF